MKCVTVLAHSSAGPNRRRAQLQPPIPAAALKSSPHSPADIDITYPATEVDAASLDLEILASSLENHLPVDISQAALDLGMSAEDNQLPHTPGWYTPPASDATARPTLLSSGASRQSETDLAAVQRRLVRFASTQASQPSEVSPRSDAAGAGIVPRSLFEAKERRDSSPPRLPSTSGAPATPPSTDFYSLGMDVAHSVGMTLRQFDKSFVDHLKRCLFRNERFAVFYQQDVPTLVQIESFTRTPGDFIAKYSRGQFSQRQFGTIRVSDLYAVPASALHQPFSSESASNIQPLTEYFRDAFTVWSASSIQASSGAKDDGHSGASAFPANSRGRGRGVRGGLNPRNFQGSGVTRNFQGNPLSRFNAPDDNDSACDPSDQLVNSFDSLARELRSRARDKQDSPFKRWDPKKIPVYRGDCRLGSELSDVTSLPHLWLDHVSSNLNFHGVQIRYWVFGALQCVTMEIAELYKQECERSIALVDFSWDYAIDRLQRQDDLPAAGTLPDDDPLSWAVFSEWLRFQFTDVSLVSQQLKFLIALRQQPGVITTLFNSTYLVQKKRLEDLSLVLPEHARENFDSVEWRKRYLQSLLPSVRSIVNHFLAEQGVAQMVSLRGRSSELSFKERLHEQRRIYHSIDGITLVEIMDYAALMDRDGSLSRIISSPAARATSSSAISRASTVSQPSSNTYRPRRVHHLALEDGAVDSVADTRDDAEPLSDTPELLFARMASQRRNVWSRDQIVKLKENKLCFNCAKPGHLSRDCPNPSADPKSIQLTNIETDDLVHILPDDSDLYSLLHDYASLNEGAPAEQQ